MYEKTKSASSSVRRTTCASRRCAATAARSCTTPVTVSERLDRLFMSGKPELGRDAREARIGEEPVRARPALLDDRVLQQPMHEDHVGTREIEAAILITIDDERPVVHDELEVETADGTAGIARARRRTRHVQQPIGEIEVAGLDELDQQLAAGERRLRSEAEHGIAFQLHELHRRAQRRSDQLRELGHDRVRMLEFGAGQERRVPGDVCEEQIALHDTFIDLTH